MPDSSLMPELLDDGAHLTEPSLSIPRRRRTPADLLIVLPFILLFLVQLAHHQLWRDESNAWGIAVASPTLHQLFTYIHYEGHPSLWYILLWMVSRFSGAPVAMKFLEALVGTAIYLVLAWRSPFSRLETVLLYASYFVSFEYTVMSRMYGALFLLVLLYAHHRAAQPERVLPNAALLALMANTDTLGILLSSALAVEYIINRRFLRQPDEKPTTLRQLAGAAAVYCAGLLISLATLWPSKHLSWRTTGRMFEYARNPGHLAFTVVCYLVLPWFPIDPTFPRHFWNPSPTSSWKIFYLCMVPVVAGMLYLLFRRERNLLVLLALATGSAIAFGHLIYLGSSRQYGITFMAFLMALWIQRYRRPQIPRLSYLFLGLSALGGAIAAPAQWLHPFSNAANAAHWIRSHSMSRDPLIGTKDTSTVGIAEELQRPMYFLECSCTDTFLWFADRRDQYSDEQLPQRLALAAQQIHAPEALFISTAPLTPEEVNQIHQRSLQVVPVAQFTGAEVVEEDFFLYKITQIPAQESHSQLRLTAPPAPPHISVTAALNQRNGFFHAE